MCGAPLRTSVKHKWRRTDEEYTSMKCPACEHEIANDATTCPFCGASVEQPIQNHFSTAVSGSPENKKFERTFKTRQKILGILSLAVSTFLYAGIRIFQNHADKGLFFLSLLAVFVAGTIVVLLPDTWEAKQKLVPSMTLVLCGILFLGFNMLTSDGASAELNLARVKVCWTCIAIGFVWGAVVVRRMHTDTQNGIDGDSESH
jgi:endogenous inhibitor of DNA gyrase (YacG/DUF329 family)